MEVHITADDDGVSHIYLVSLSL